MPVGAGTTPVAKSRWESLAQKHGSYHANKHSEVCVPSSQTDGQAHASECFIIRRGLCLCCEVELGLKHSLIS